MLLQGTCFCNRWTAGSVPLGYSNRSVPILLQGRVGGLVGLSGSGGCFFAYSAHLLQLSIKCLMSADMPGQYRITLALCWHLEIPRWLLWICCSTSGLSFCRTTIRVPLKMRPSVVAISSLNVQYGLASTGVLALVSDQPFLIEVITACSSGSLSVSIWNSAYLSSDIARTILNALKLFCCFGVCVWQRGTA